jgi:hypothetical protein
MLKILIFNILDKRLLVNQLVNKLQIKRPESLIFSQAGKNSHLLSSPCFSLSEPILIPLILFLPHSVLNPVASSTPGNISSSSFFFFGKVLLI